MKNDMTEREKELITYLKEVWSKIKRGLITMSIASLILLILCICVQFLKVLQ